MGICPLDPELRIINDRNHELLGLLRRLLGELRTYGFAQQLLREVDGMQPRYLYTEGVIEDIMKMESYVKASILKHSTYSGADNLEDELRGSCLILQNEAGAGNDENEPEGEPADSFQHNMKQNKSLVVQINIIYRPEIDREEYSQSLRLFLKWAQVFQEHSYGGFLKPLYGCFYRYVSGLGAGEWTGVVDETAVFVQMMGDVVSEVYGLRQLARSDHGKLFKTENVYNLIMSVFFRRTSVKRFLLTCIRHNDHARIILLERQLHRLARKPTHFFGISSKFALTDSALTESEINRSIEDNAYIQPYAQSLRLVAELTKPGTPITKLKTIVSVSKEITRDIGRYYQGQNREPPELDPDNLSSIVMYLLVKNGSPAVYEELSIVERFTTTNCLNCISGFYLNVFMAAIESLIVLEDE